MPKNILREQNGGTRGLNNLFHDVILQDCGLHEDTEAAVGCENLSNVCERVHHANMFTVMMLMYSCLAGMFTTFTILC